MQVLDTDVLIAGGGTAGVCAAIQAARDGVNVTLVTETLWLGGMLTTAGVSCTDGNQQLPAGIWGEFRQKLYDYYGGPDSVDTGWVSHTNFEPHVGHQIFKNWIEIFSNINIYYEFYFKRIKKEDHRVTGAIFEDKKGDRLAVQARITIDATEQGDLLAAAGCDFRTGVDSCRDTGEKQAPERSANILQDITYVATLKDYGGGADKTISKPPDYDPDHYLGCCREHCRPSQDVQIDARKMLSYGRLPNGKYMLNWPIQGNDFYLDVLNEIPIERDSKYQAAKNFTLGFVYLIQSELGFSHLGLADDEFPTDDRLPFYPYFRESRRVKGLVTLTVDDLLDPYGSAQGQIYKSGIAVGDYPLDHHHAKAPQKVAETFPSIPSYNLPYGCLVPQKIKGLLITEKSISVSHLVNGTTRLQPVVMQIGQAAGAAAALCSQQKIQPAEVPIRVLQQTLLDKQGYIMPFVELTPEDHNFQAVQRIGASGVMLGTGQPHNWANKTLFHPLKKVTLNSFYQILSRLNLTTPSMKISENQVIDRRQALTVLYQTSNAGKIPTSMSGNRANTERISEKAWQFYSRQAWFIKLSRAKGFQLAEPLTRQELAVLIDHIFNPFNKQAIQITRNK